MMVKFSCARYGWLSRVERARTGEIIGFHWTKFPQGATPYPEKDAEEIHARLYEDGIMHDVVRAHWPWDAPDEDDGK